MTKVISVLAVVIGIAGCASSAPEAPLQSAGDVSGTDVKESVATGSGAENASSAEEIEFMDAPEVEKVASVRDNRDDMICKRVQLTGSHRMEKICRPRSEVESTMRNSQEAVRKLERNAAKSVSN